MPRLAFISDTHTLQGRTSQLLVEAKADILVHCGDITADDSYKKVEEMNDFAAWCANLLRKGHVKHIVAIAVPVRPTER